MKKWRNKLALLLISGFCLAQTGDLVPPEVRRVGDRLACLCGSCKNTVATCQMLGCHYTAPARQQISAMSKAGKSDDEIVAEFVKREGQRALAGIGLIAWFIRRNKKPAQPAPEMTEGDMAKYHQAAERELSRFDE